VQKAREKACQDRHIKKKQFKVDDFVLLYDSKFLRFPGKFRTHWMGPYRVVFVIDGGVVQLKKLDGTLLPERVNGSRLKLYRAYEPLALDI